MNENAMYHKLPASAYTSQEWFDKEQDLIFSKTWRYAGLQEDLTEPGQYMSVKAGNNNIFIVMGHDKRLRAFHNVCRHRGTELIRAVGKTQKALTCPYHDWTYDLEGNLISVPDEETEYKGRNLDKKCLGLRPASVDIWHSMIFVHPDPDAGSIMEWFGDCEQHLGPHQPTKLPEYKQAHNKFQIKSNWKIVVENYIDIYHLSHLHSNTLNMFDHAKGEFTFVGPHYMFWEPLADFYKKDIKKLTETPLVIPEEKAGTVWVPMFFPGIGVAQGPGLWSTFIITPLAPDLTEVENRVRVADASSWQFLKEYTMARTMWPHRMTPKYGPEDAMGEDDPMASGNFIAEDNYACEQQQKAFASDYFDIGPAAAGEEPILGHQQAIINFMEEQQKKQEKAA